MDKILAFSILSSSPAEISGVGYATLLSLRSGRGKQATEKKELEDKVEQSSTARPARFAPEFDGLNCFEYIVSS